MWITRIDTAVLAMWWSHLPNPLYMTTTVSDFFVMSSGRSLDWPSHSLSVTWTFTKQQLVVE